MRPAWGTPDGVVSAYWEAVEQLAAVPAQRLSTTVEVCGRVVGSRRLATGRHEAVLCGGPSTTRGTRLHRVADDWLGERLVLAEVAVCAACGQAWQPAEREVGMVRSEVRVRGRVGWDQGGGRVVRAPAAVRPGQSERRTCATLDRLRPLAKIVETPPVLRVWHGPRAGYVRRRMSASEWDWTLRLWRVLLHPMVGTYAKTARLAQEWLQGAEPSASQVERLVQQGRAVIEGRMRRNAVRLRQVA